jgi:hypothetical protein
MTSLWARLLPNQTLLALVDGANTGTLVAIHRLVRDDVNDAIRGPWSEVHRQVFASTRTGR